ncbi:hypothetical protein [Pseudomonas syringae]|uniref:hypothetical protein n=1 Tax=Pseudomonas syringae TaxID=317 RepID=UPI001F373153|nr:hypothetical protein [Pseudomonas syringae]MCF5722226.1 hypothetical protein [Pseudomonas syringae]
MNSFTAVFSVSAVLAITTGSALAGPEVRVTFKNIGDKAATYAPLDSNQFTTKNNASPTPSEKVAVNAADAYTVQSQTSPLVNYASVRYVMGNKSCEFLTSFVSTLGFAGTRIPKWNHSATPSGGATCTIRSTGTRLSDYSWSVEMTMR